MNGYKGSKVFRADSVKKAVELMHVVMGPTAEVVSAKKVKAKGFKGVFGKLEYEIEGAVSMVQRNRLKAPARPFSFTAISDQKAFPDFKIPHEENIQETKPEQKPSAGTEELKKMTEIEKRIDVLAEKIEKMVTEVSKSGDGKKREEKVDPVFKMLKDTGLSAELINEILGRINCDRKPDEDGNATPESINEMILDEMEKYIQTSGPIILDDAGKPKVVVIAGPTGVGKTTTIAKIGAHFAFTERKKIAVITLDTYRIAAIDQLKTYAEIMGVPFEIAYSPQEFKDMVDKYSDYDLILVDTVGRCHKNVMELSQLKGFLTSINKPVEFYLLMSAVTKVGDMVEIMKKYEMLSYDKVIITKIDETDSCGTVLNVLKKMPKKVAYVTTGQNVPEDIETADSRKIARYILKGRQEAVKNE